MNKKSMFPILAIGKEMLESLSMKLQLPVIAGADGGNYYSMGDDCGGGCMGDCQGNCLGCDGCCEGLYR